MTRFATLLSVISQYALAVSAAPKYPFDAAVHTSAVLEPTLCSLQDEKSLCYDGFTRNDLAAMCTKPPADAGHVKAKQLFDSKVYPCERYVVSDTMSFWSLVNKHLKIAKTQRVSADVTAKKRLNTYLAEQRCKHAKCGLQSNAPAAAALIIDDKPPVEAAAQSSAALFLAGKAASKCDLKAIVPKENEGRQELLALGSEIKCNELTKSPALRFKNCIDTGALPSNYPSTKRELWLKLAQQSICRCLTAFLLEPKIEKPTIAMLKEYLEGENADQLCSVLRADAFEKRRQFMRSSPDRFEQRDDALKKVLKVKPTEPKPNEKLVPQRKDTEALSPPTPKKPEVQTQVEDVADYDDYGEDDNQALWDMFAKEAKTN